MNITQVTQQAGAHRRRKRVGRGESSGKGKTSGRGHKGAGARAGHRAKRIAEGGMFPLFRRIPKYGFSNAKFCTRYQVVNVVELERRFETDGLVTAASLEEAGLIRDEEGLVKLLGKGELSKRLKVEAHRFSATAVSKIESAGGTVKWLAPKPKKKFIKRPKHEANQDAESKPKAKTKAKAKTKGQSLTEKEPAPAPAPPKAKNKEKAQNRGDGRAP